MIKYIGTGYDLLHAGCIALAQVEANGILLDVEYLERTIAKVERRIKVLEKKLQSGKVWDTWKKRYGAKANLGSRAQLGVVLFEDCGFKSAAKTKSGRDKADIEALEKIDNPFIKIYVDCAKLKKLAGTYLKSIQRLVSPDNRLRPSFNLHTVTTFRGSCSNPNFQNIPIRDPKIGKLIRQAFIASPGNRLIEIDYSGIEVRIAACYHKDPTMLKYIRDPSKDMHRDMAAECFMCKPEQVGKMERYCAKNMFVFPQFYGDWYIDCARHLWDAMTQHDLKVDMVPMREHVAELGITSRGKCDPKQRPRPHTFEKHIKDIETDFWERRFPVYAKWKKRRYANYLKTGKVDIRTGFVCRGMLKRNEVINYPVQGAAFHCLLWSLIRLQQLVKKHKMKSMIVGQIHDSIIADVPDDEVELYISLADQVMTDDLLKEWTWIQVPLEIEVEQTPIGGSWFEKEEVQFT